MDYRNSNEELGKNTIIYGHNMKDNSMFGSLANILNESSKKDWRIRLDFLNETYEWEIVSAYKTRNTDWMQVDFATIEQYTNFLNKQEVKENKILKSDNLTESDKLITLATCTTHIHDERLVVQAKLIQEE